MRGRTVLATKADWNASGAHVLTRLRAVASALTLGHQSSWSTNRQIASAALTVGVATACVSLISMVRELIVAASFGTGDVLDAFIVAIVVPSFVINVFGGSVASALIPTWVRVHDQEGPAEAQHVLSSIVALGTSLLIGVSLVLALASSAVVPVVASGFSAEKMQLTQRLFLIFLPAILFGGLAAIWSAVLNAKDRFGLVAYSQALIPVATICALIVGGQWGIYALTAGVVVGYALRLAALGWELIRLDVAIWPRWHGITAPVRQVVSQYMPLIAGVALLSSSAIIDQAVAATLPPGSVATLGYGTKVVALATGLGAAALGTAVLPFFSRMVAAGNWNQLRHSLRTFSMVILAIALAGVAVLGLFSVPIVSFLFERGAFTQDDTLMVARVQTLSALQLPFFGIAILYSRVISSLGANRLLLWQAAICLPANVLLDIILSRYFGVAGIALATAGMYAIALVFLVIVGRRELARASG